MHMLPFFNKMKIFLKKNTYSQFFVYFLEMINNDKCNGYNECEKYILNCLIVVEKEFVILPEEKIVMIISNFLDFDDLHWNGYFDFTSTKMDLYDGFQMKKLLFFSC